MEETTKKKMNLFAYRVEGVGARGKRGIFLGVSMGDEAAVTSSVNDL